MITAEIYAERIRAAIEAVPEFARIKELPAHEQANLYSYIERIKAESAREFAQKLAELERVEGEPARIKAQRARDVAEIKAEYARETAREVARIKAEVTDLEAKLAAAEAMSAAHIMPSYLLGS
jgi:hypothetical protein